MPLASVMDYGKRRAKISCLRANRTLDRVFTRQVRRLPRTGRFRPFCVRVVETQIGFVA